jgi:MFS transporter, ACS family, glucarate transporter
MSTANVTESQASVLKKMYAGKTHVRYLILAVLFVTTIINYLDRSALGIAAPALQKDLYMDAVTLGLAFSAFNWAYTIFQLPGGWLLDRFGARNVWAE